MPFCIACGTSQTMGDFYCSKCGSPVGANLPGTPMTQHGTVMENSADHMIRRIADYERISGILWIVLGAIQVLSIFGILAGIWNIFAGISRIRLVTAIQQRDSSIPARFEGVASLVIIGVINLFLGGIIGIVFVAFDFYVRDCVLSNRSIFNAMRRPV